MGGGYRYSLCPRCYSIDRKRLIYWFIVNKTNILNSDKTINLLHIAPEKNLQNTLKSSSHIEYISGDLNSLMGCDIRLDIIDMNFEDNFFDVIIRNHVLEHIVDDRKAMRELFRVLRLKGFAILQVPISKKAKETFEDFSITSPEERERYFGQKDHLRIYDKYYKERLESVGFKLDLYDIKKDLSIKEIKILGTAKYDLYSEIANIQQKNKNKRVLLGVQQTMFRENYNKQIYSFLKILLNSKGKYLISIRFHPAIIKKKRRKFVQELKKMNSVSGVVIEISDIEDPIKDISKSAIILTSKSTLGTEAMLLRKPVIEYLSSKRNDAKKFKDYRDFVLHASTGKDAEVLILKFFNSDNFYDNVIEKQNKFVNSEIMHPLAIPRILDFINSLNDNKRE